MKGITINPKGFHKDQVKFYIVLIPLALFMALPIVYIINHAFKPLSELYAFPPKFVVENPTIDNFRDLAKVSSESIVSIGRYALNSFLTTFFVVTLNILVGSMAGFALSKLEFKGKKLLFEINTISMMFVPAAVLIPRYLVIDKIRIMDTYFAHTLPLVAMPVAAVVDGAGKFVIYRKVILPLIKPAIATTCILSFQQVWGNIETSSMFTSRESMRTLAFYMSTLVNANATVAGQGIAAAASLIMFLPNILLFVILQSQVMNTMAHSGIK